MLTVPSLRSIVNFGRAIGVTGSPLISCTRALQALLKALLVAARRVSAIALRISL